MQVDVKTYIPATRNLNLHVKWVLDLESKDIYLQPSSTAHKIYKKNKRNQKSGQYGEFCKQQHSRVFIIRQEAKQLSQIENERNGCKCLQYWDFGFTSSGDAQTCKCESMTLAGFVLLSAPLLVAILAAETWVGVSLVKSLNTETVDR